ncbi:MAG: hypothetical protein ACYTGN_09845 [Planctomycetota bacterium]
MAPALALILLVAQAPPTLTHKFDQNELTKVIKVFETYCGAKIELDPHYKARRISLKLNNATLPAALQTIANDLGAVVVTKAADHYELLPVWKRDLRAKLDSTEVPNLQQAMGLATLRETLVLVGNVARVNIVVDPALDLGKNTMDLMVTGVSLRQLLDLVTAPNELAYELRYGVVFVARPARLKQLPLRLGVPTPGDKRITAEFKGVTLDKALAEIAKQADLAIEPPAPLPDTKLKLAFRGLTADQALAVLTLPLGLKVEKTKKGLRVVP